MSQHTSTSNSVAAAEITADERSFDEQLHSGPPTVFEEPSIDALFDYEPVVSLDMLFDYPPVEHLSSHASNTGNGFTYSGNGKDVTALCTDYECQGQRRISSWVAASQPNGAAQKNVAGLEKDATRWASGDRLLDSIQQISGSRYQGGWAEPPGH